MIKEMIGKKFGRLTVISKSSKTNSSKSYYYNCICDCGNKTINNGMDIRRGESRSCGCLRKERLIKMNTTHGKTGTKTFNVWRGILQRCSYKKFSQYHYYGGRGIRVCKRWLTFANFLKDMGESKKGYWIERINNNADYKPSNCKWGTTKEQSRNKRNNIFINYKNKRQTLKDWSIELNINYDTLKSRVSRLGWDKLDALKVPIQKRG